jgi:hypothetical protein
MTMPTISLMVVIPISFNANYFFDGGDPRILQFIKPATVCPRRAQGHM